MTEQNDLTFEQALNELQTIVARLESGDGSLEENLALYERGMSLVRYCNDMLDAAHLRVRELLPDGSEVDFQGPLDTRA
ncbi:MAG: exodeoxyribonuclease VII small subunit [Chloroflexi bacterium]|nr:exodeoxyribonuclease VII small subunit [Chloroflexota bacterium]